MKICKNCKDEMVLRKSDYGMFWGCSNFPKCRNTEKILEINTEFKKKYGKNKRELFKDHGEIEYYTRICSKEHRQRYDYEIGSVYIIYIKLLNLIKIGSSIDVINRVISLAKEHKYFNGDFYESVLNGINLIKVYDTYNYKTLEAQLHFIFKDKLSFKNEYFNINIEDICNLKIDTICGIDVIENKNAILQFNNLKDEIGI